MKFKESLLAPITALRWRYVPLLMIYFAYGASAFSGIAESFFVKEHLDISAHGLLVLGAWLTIPWTMKMVFGQLADSVPLLGSNRKIYIFIAAILMICSTLLLVGLTQKTPWLMSLGHPNSIYFVSSLIMVIGVVLQDVIADAMSVEVVEKENRRQEDIDHDLAMVQLLGRLSLSVAGFLVAGLGGWLAQRYSYTTMFLIALVIPFISITACLFIKVDTADTKPIKPYILYGGLIYAAIITILGLIQFPFHQEVIFFFSLGIVCFFLYRLTNGLDKKALHNIVLAAVVIFVFRAMPGVGPGLQWWEIDVLGFSKAFFGTLAQIGIGLSIIGMWFFARPVTQKPIGLVLLVLTILSFFLSLPVLGMYYGLHNWTQEIFGFGAHTIAIVDTAVASPFAQLSMIPMLALIAINAPKGNVATWFALMSSLMNLALTAGSLVSKWFNKVWIINRAIYNAQGKLVTPANYDHLGILIWLALLIGLIVPVLTIVICRPKDLNIRR